MILQVEFIIRIYIVFFMLYQKNKNKTFFHVNDLLVKGQGGAEYRLNAKGTRLIFLASNFLSGQMPP